MINNQIRVGNFTSSKVVALTTVAKDKVSFGAPALTYIDEKNMERRLGRSIDAETDARPLTWGKLLEKRTFNLLGMEYVLSSTETDIHPTIPYWAGSKDGIKHDQGKTVIDIKCPMTLKSFCQLVDPLYEGLSGTEAMNKIRDKHKEGDTYYWQLVSNAIINDAKYAELIVYMPYFSELDDIRFMAQSVDADQLSKHYWIGMANNLELPFILDEGYYKNVNVIRFEVPQEDKELLTDCVKRAGKILINNPSALIEEQDKKTGATIIDSIKLQKI